MMIYWLVISLLLPAVIIRIVGGLSRSFTVDDWGSAFLMVAAMWAVGWVLVVPMEIANTAMLELIHGSPVPPVPTSPWSASLVVVIGLSFVTDVLLLFILGLLLPGVSVRGIVGILVAAALMAVLSATAPFLLALAA
jgi:hypothetical protein